MALKEPFNPADLPAAEVAASGRPVAARDAVVDRYPGIRRFVALGFKHKVLNNCAYIEAGYR